MDLFVYGTLMDDAVVQELVGRVFPKAAAVLPGYRKVSPQGGYPYIVPDPDGAVEGWVLRDVDATALRAFDEYEEEGRLYRRTAVIVGVDGEATTAWAYLGMAEAFSKP